MPAVRPLLATFASLLSLAPFAAAQRIFVLTDSNRLLSFDRGTPGTIDDNLEVKGLLVGEKLLGIDFRPANGQLYAVSSTSRLYQINTNNGFATQVGPVLTTLLSGTEFGIDFNPTVDRIRVTSNSGQNLRLHPDTGAVAAVDGNLAFAATDVNAARTANVTASAYTNNFSGATSTTLYDLDTTLDILATQNPPNSGTLNTVGSLGINVIAVNGFDIAGGTGTAYAALTTPGVMVSQLFTIDLPTGAASFVATIGTHELIRGLSVFPTPGAVPYGTATPGCQGPSAIGANSSPFVGNANFAITCVNAPPSVPGLLMQGVNPLTSPVVLSGLSIWIDPSVLIWFTVASSDAAGTASSPLGIPAQPGLVGVKLFLQYFWRDACLPIGLSASNAIGMTIQQ